MVQPVCRDPEKVPAPEQLPATQFGGGVEMANSRSQKDSGATINPKLILEGGQNDWDPARPISAETNW